jgi:hypothetical protein
MMSHYILPGRRNFSNKHCKGNQNKHFIANTFPKIIPFIEITKNTIQPGRPMVTEHSVVPKSLKLHDG